MVAIANNKQLTFILGDPGADIGGEEKSKRAEKYGTFLRAIFFRPFRLSLALTIYPWVSGEDEFTLGMMIVFCCVQEIKCQHMNTNLVFFFSKKDHLTLCLLKIVPCVNKNCSETMTLNNLFQHMITTCPWRILRCTYCSESHPECKTEVRILFNCPGFASLQNRRSLLLKYRWHRQ